MEHGEDRADEPLPAGEWVENKFAALWPPAEWRPNVDVGRALLARGQRVSFGRLPRIVLALAAILIIAVFLAFPQSGVLAERCVTACVAGTSALGVVLGISPKPAVPLTAGRLAPLFALPDARGAAVNLAALRGKVVILNFWATWCAPCQVEIPWFVEFRDRFGNQGLEIIGVSMDDDGWTSVRPWLQDHSVNYPIVSGDDEIEKKYGGIEALPTTFVIDRAGRIASQHIGLESKGAYEDEVERLLAGRRP